MGLLSQKPHIRLTEQIEIEHQPADPKRELDHIDEISNTINPQYELEGSADPYQNNHEAFLLETARSRRYVPNVVWGRHRWCGKWVTTSSTDYFRRSMLEAISAFNFASNASFRSLKETDCWLGGGVPGMACNIAAILVSCWSSLSCSSCLLCDIVTHLFGRKVSLGQDFVLRYISASMSLRLKCKAK